MVQTSTDRRQRALPFYKPQKNGQVEIARLLLEAGAKFDVCSRDDKRNPLTEASNNGHRYIVDLLLRNHANVDRQTRIGSALLAAAREGHTSVVRLLLEHGADYEATHNLPSLHTIRLWLDYYAPRNGDDPLTGASTFGHTEVVRLFLE
ncbi:ankyrin repeat-containing domain protein [Colletotrichum phormii]|uniref:Ankyrin repeat-containing domain protein n=1 Tax=Colletotrichum phormii TaxID=359342 RepID=A0AAI9ZHU0_9PEZI|nr:ankyrin repeat-containing domain protein [Colletotrichum phormii]KAK1624830.1 ankyrin repeat-containing domain protein [Colletotrichum phormii]